MQLPRVPFRCLRVYYANKQELPMDKFEEANPFLDLIDVLPQLNVDYLHSTFFCKMEEALAILAQLRLTRKKNVFFRKF